MPLRVRELTRSDAESNDAFVRAHPQGSPFHLWAWRASMEETFGYRGMHLIAERDGAVEGVVPLFLVSGFMTGRALISSPFAVYGGALARSEEARSALRERIEAMGRELEVQYVELRNGWPEQCLGFAPVERYVTFTFPSIGDPEELLAAVPKKTRNLVRKSLKHPFSMRRQTSEWRAFERLHSKTLRRLGTPSFPPAHFEALMRNFGDGIDVREVLLEDRIVAVAMNFLFRDQMHTYYAASDPDYLAYAPNNYLYYEQILWAARNGYPVFEFGRSKLNTGTYEFKKHFGAQVRPLPYEILLVKRRDMPNFSPANKKFDVAIQVWQRLPLFVTRLLGPRLVRLFP